MRACWARFDCEDGCNNFDAWIVPNVGQEEHTMCKEGMTAQV
jgi:hypothetical protein